MMRLSRDVAVKVVLACVTMMKAKMGYPQKTPSSAFFSRWKPASRIHAMTKVASIVQGPVLTFQSGTKTSMSLTTMTTTMTKNTRTSTNAKACSMN